MATNRVGCARRLASVLTKETGTLVAVCFQRSRNHYRVVWTDGPTESRMRELAEAHAGEIPDLEVPGLAWQRGTSGQPSVAEHAIANDVPKDPAVPGNARRRRSPNVGGP